MEIEEITDVQRLDRLAGEWSELCDRCPWTTPFQRPEWLLPWCRHFDPEPLWVVTFRRAGLLVGLAPFFHYTRPRGEDADWQEERVLALLGSGNSDYLDVLLEPGIEEAAVATLFSMLAARSDRWDVCDLDPLRAGSPLLAAPLPPGWSEDLYTLAPSPVLELPDCLEELPARIPHRQSKNLRQARRRAGRLGALRSFAADDNEREALLAALARLHGARWERRGLPGVLADPDILAFHQEVAAGFGRRSCLALHGLALDGHLLGVYYGFYEQRGAYFYLHGFDPDWSRWSPGFLLIGHALEEAVRRGAACFDFLSGAEDYKYHWGGIDRPNTLRRLRLPGATGRRE